MTDDAAIDVAEVARRCGVSADVVYDWIHSGELPVERLGTGKKRATYRIDPADLAAFREARRTRKPAPKGGRARRPAVRPEVANATRYF